MFKTHENLVNNDNVYIQIKILDFPWTPVSNQTMANSGWDVVFHIQQREKENQKFRKNET